METVHMGYPFLRDTSEYVRNIDLIEHYHQNMGTYLRVMTPMSGVEAIAFSKRNAIPNDPMLKVLERVPDGDRYKRKVSLLDLLKNVHHNSRFLSPSMVVYENPDVKLSFVAEYLINGINGRNSERSLAKAAFLVQDYGEATFRNNNQANFKTGNNTVSGSHVSEHNPLHNPSCHTTLTSICRCATSYSNAAVEKMLAGNRHYTTELITLGELAALIRHADMSALEKVITQFNMTIPTVTQLSDYIKKNTLRYWESKAGWGSIHAFISKMSPMERVAVAYTNDLNAMRLFSPKATHLFLTKLAEKKEASVETAGLDIGHLREEMAIHVGLVMSDEIKGISLSDAKKDKPETYSRYYNTVKNVESVMEEYREFIANFFLTDNLPSSIYDIMHSVRKIVPLSDTDSTLFTLQDWVEWLQGSQGFERRHRASAGAVFFVFASHVNHMLALMSRNMGATDENLFRLVMKGEFYQPVLAVTNMTKHYTSFKWGSEGDFYDVMEMDTKGSNLKNSKHPPEITDILNKYIKQMMEWAMVPLEQRPGIKEMLRVPSQVSDRILTSLSKGEMKYLSSGKVNTKEAYTNPEASPLIYYKFWNTVFGAEHGYSDLPPYDATKVAVTITKKGKYKEWLATQDPTFAGKFSRAMEDMGRTYLTSILVPTAALSSGQLPKEIHSMLDYRRIETELTAGFTIMLETAGVQTRNKKMSRLLSEEVDVAIYEGQNLDDWAEFLPPA